MSSLAELKKNAVVEIEDDSVMKQKLLEELMVLRFKIKMTKDLYKAGVKNTKDLKKKLRNIYFRKLKMYCEMNNFTFDDDLKKCEVELKIQELKKEMSCIVKGAESFSSIISKVL
jgi:hypothetical protein